METTPTVLTIVRLLLGLMFAIAGLSGFILISHPPQEPAGLAGDFQTVFFRSRWVLFVDGVQLIAGLMLLRDRYVPLALVVLGAVLSNIVVFHVTMAPAGLPLAAVITALWAFLAANDRTSFAPLLIARATRETDAPLRAPRPNASPSTRP